MKCPNCGVAAAAEALDCVSCGVIFAKFNAKKERGVLEAKIALSQADKADAVPRFDPLKARTIAAGFVILWVCAFGLYYRHTLAQRAKVPIKDRPFVMMRDPATGEMRRIPVIVSPVYRPKRDEP